MDVVDRVTATDRAVAAYRRFVECETLDVVPDMVSDLLHWYRIMIDTAVTVDKLMDILIAAIGQYQTELEAFGLGSDPTFGRRNRPAGRAVFAPLVSAFPDETTSWHPFEAEEEEDIEF